MRVCIFTPSIDLAHLDKRTLLSELDCSLDEKDVEEVYFVTYKSPPSEPAARLAFCGLWEYPTRRVRLCRGLFRLLENRAWLPSSLSLLPLYLCQKELLEALLACDPDVVVVHDLHWNSRLRALIQRRYPQWTCLAPGDRTVKPGRRWRKFDPSPTVSIVLPTYNGVKYIRQSVESCLKQTFETIELIVVDDGSSEDIQGIVEGYRDSHIKYFRHDKNRGLSEALNTGFRNSTGQYLTWTSDDNYFAEDAIERMVAFLQTYPEVDFVCADSVVITGNADGTILRTLRAKPPQTLRSSNGVTPCFLYKRNVYEAIGNYDASCFLAEDYDYWMRISRHFRLQRMFRLLYYYRRHADSLTDKYGKEAVARQAGRVRQRNRA
jgi:Glycosyl transferase family 2